MLVGKKKKYQLFLIQIIFFLTSCCSQTYWYKWIQKALMGVSSSLLLQTKALEVRILQHSQNQEKVIHSFFIYLFISKLPHHHERRGRGDRKLEKTWGRGNGLMRFLVLYKANVVVEWCREGCMCEWIVRADPSMQRICNLEYSIQCWKLVGFHCHIDWFSTKEG